MVEAITYECLVVYGVGSIGTTELRESKLPGQYVIAAMLLYILIRRKMYDLSLIRPLNPLSHFGPEKLPLVSKVRESQA